MSIRDIVVPSILGILIYHIILLITYSSYDDENRFHRKISIYYIIPYLIKQFIQFQQSLKQRKMLNTKALIKALSFLCLPTLSVLLILYFWFLDFGRFTAFVTSDSAFAGIMRVILIIAEICLVYHMYCYYDGIMPNEKLNDRLYESILGDKFKLINRIDSTNSGKRLSIDYSDAEKLSSVVNPSAIDNYRAAIYTCPDIPNIAIIKKISKS